MAKTDSSKELDLSNKSLGEIPPGVFKTEEVEILNVSGNPLRSIPVDIGHLTNLKEMIASGCELREISGNISKCKYLRRLVLSWNPHIATLPLSMKNLEYLKYVALSSCRLRSFPTNLTLLATVETLDMSTNALTTLPSDMSGLKQIKVLNLNDNLFKNIPKGIKSLGSLECLEMKRNRLTNRLNDLVLNAPSQLKVLDLEHNSSLTLVPYGLENLEAIEGVNFSHCGIESLPDSIGQISTLKEFHLVGNKLRTLPDGFGRLLNLETLNLEGNSRLSSLPLSLHRLRKLKDKEKGMNTGLLLDSVVVDMIIENLSIDIVTIAEGDLYDGFMMDMTDVVLVEQEQLVVLMMDELIEETKSLMTIEVVTRAVRLDAMAWEMMEELLEETNRSMAMDVTTMAVQLDVMAWGIMEELLKEIVRNTALDAAARVVIEEFLSDVTLATAKSVALEEEEEWRRGLSVPDEYDKQCSYEVSATALNVQSLDLPAGCNLSIPPGATEEDTSVITVVLNPHGYDGRLELDDTQLLVSDIIEMRPSGMTFSEPVKLKIPHSLPKFDCEREYTVMTSGDEGRTWVALKTLSEQEHGQRFVTVEVTHFSSFAVVAKPLKHCHRVRKGEASTLTSSEQTGIKVILLEDCMPKDEEISFNVTPVDRDTLACAGMEDSKNMEGIHSMSHIVNFIKGSNLLLNSPATIVLPLSPGEEDSRVRVLSCNVRGDWEDVTSKVGDVVLQGSKVAFKTGRISSGFAVIRCNDGTDVSGIVNLVTRNVRARRVRTVIFKKWKEPRENGIMTARMECVLEESVDDRICRTITEDKYELQEGTPTPAVAMLENETICAIFHGNIRPADVEMVNGMYGVNFRFYCERTRRLEFDVEVLDLGEDSFSMVELLSGRREDYHTMSPWETAKPATPLAIAGITAPRNQEVSVQRSEESVRENNHWDSDESGRERSGQESEASGSAGGFEFDDQLSRFSHMTISNPSVTVDSRLPIVDYGQLDFPGRSLIGQGSFASVKKAFHRSWRQDVAVKSLTFEIYGTSEQDLLYSEARKLNVGSRSDYVIRLLGICLQPQFAIVMPFMENGSLTDQLQNIEVPWALRWRMARETAMGMTFLHSQDPQIIHCDLKAENVLLDGDFHVKISDFGLSKWKMQSRIVTETSPMGGTATHVPPEFFDTDAGPTDKTDVYSFGVLLWEIATRRRPYRDTQGRLNISTPLSCYVTGGGRPDMSLVPTGVPGVDTVNQLMQACWSQSPHDRPSFQECVDQLRDVNDLSSDEDVLEAIINVRREKKAVK